MCTQKDNKSKRKKDTKKTKDKNNKKQRDYLKREFIIGQVKIGRKEQLFAHLWTISIDRLCIICDL